MAFVAVMGGLFRILFALVMGVNIGGSRVMIGAPGGDPTRMSPRSMPMGGVPTMDAGSVRFLSESCPIG